MSDPDHVLTPAERLVYAAAFVASMQANAFPRHDRGPLLSIQDRAAEDAYTAVMRLRAADGETLPARMMLTYFKGIR